MLQITLASSLELALFGLVQEFGGGKKYRKVLKYCKVFKCFWR